MAVTILVRAAPASGAPRAARGTADAPPLRLTFDTPRLVIGRGDTCDVRLPDPSVSHRHASIRQRGAEYVIVDEKSTNGTFLGRVGLAPNSPRVLRSGELVRIGRVWLEVRFELAVPPFANAAAARQVALTLCTAGLAEQGEEGRPALLVSAGPDAGKTLLLSEIGRSYTLGKDASVDLALAEPSAGRKQVVVTFRGEQVVVRHGGSATPTTLGEAPLGTADAVWKPGQEIAFGEDRLVLRHPAADALAELEQSQDEAIPRGEEFPLPESPGDSATAEDAETADAGRPEAKAEAPVRGRAAQPDPEDDAAPAGEGWSFTDGAVVLVALGVLALSVAGLIYLLRG
jgi:pSer/pThr/pTyr-binding forkhead associated (FHA) protein